MNEAADVSLRRSQRIELGGHFRILQLVADVLAVFLSFRLGHLTYQFLRIGFDERPFSFYSGVALVAALIFLLTYERLGLYRPRSSVLNIEEIRGLNRGLLIGSGIFLALSFYFRDENGHELSRVIITLSLGWLVVLANLARLSLTKAQQVLHRRGVGCRRVLICGTGDLGLHILRRLSGSPQLGLVPVGMMSEKPCPSGESLLGQTGQEHTRVPVLGAAQDVDRILEELAPDELILASNELDRETVARLMEVTTSKGVELRFVPDLMGFLFQDLELEIYDGIPVMRRRSFVERPMYESLKRLFDIAFSAAVLILLLPVFILVALLVKKDTPGPVFFVQDRVGKGGKLFKIFKFRTMYVETPRYEFHPKSSEDVRLTPVGKWLRRLSIDELPQFLNVLLGDMSVVGPRPEMPFIVEGYTPLQRHRLQVMPGITGLWQISADRSRMIHENMDYDMFYVHNRGLLLDIIIVIETCFMVVRGVGAH